MVRTTGLALVMIGVAGPMVSTVDAQTTEAVAIIVHPQVAEDDLSLDDLKRIFLAEQQHWGDNSRITLFVRAPSAPERDLVLSEISGAQGVCSRPTAPTPPTCGNPRTPPQGALGLGRTNTPGPLCLAQSVQPFNNPGELEAPVRPRIGP